MLGVMLDMVDTIAIDCRLGRIVYHIALQVYVQVALRVAGPEPVLKRRAQHMRACTFNASIASPFTAVSRLLETIFHMAIVSLPDSPHFWLEKDAQTIPLQPFPSLMFSCGCAQRPAWILVKLRQVTHTEYA